MIVRLKLIIRVIDHQRRRSGVVTDMVVYTISLVTTRRRIRRIKRPTTADWLHKTASTTGGSKGRRCIHSQPQKENFWWVQLNSMNENLVIMCWFYVKFVHVTNKHFPVIGPLW